jgi:prephenate dehydrogenase
MNVVIVGLGLMGGSLALSLKKLDFIKNIAGYIKKRLFLWDLLKP